MDSSSQPSQTQEANSQMSSPPNNSSGSKLIPIILGVTAVVVIAIGAYALGTKQSQPIVQNIAQTTPIPSPIPTIVKSSLQNLPSDILPEQIVGPTYSVNGNLYALVLEPTFNDPLLHIDLSEKIIKWHGILQSQDNGQTWSKFFSIADPTNSGQTIKYNPVGVFSEGGKIYADIANSLGAGSGEGQMIRFSTNDNGKTWQQNTCYYFTPYSYYMDYEQFKNGRANQENINPHSLKETKDCVY